MKTAMPRTKNSNTKFGNVVARIVLEQCSFTFFELFKRPLVCDEKLNRKFNPFELQQQQQQQQQQQSKKSKKSKSYCQSKTLKRLEIHVVG